MHDKPMPVANIKSGPENCEFHHLRVETLFLMSSNGTLKRYVPGLLTQSKGFDASSIVPYLSVGFLVTLFLYRFLAPKEKGGIRQLRGLSILSAWAFFVKRYDFVWANFGRDPHFRFKIFHVGPFLYIPFAHG